MERTTQRGRTAIVTVENTPADVARAISGLSDADLVRLQALARLFARGLPEYFGWADVMQEAIARALDGSRKWPLGVPILAFLAGVMRSICDDQWRRAQRETAYFVRVDDWGDLRGEDEPAAATDDPERMLIAAQNLADINRLFAADCTALAIIAGLAEGLTATEICALYGIPERDYDTARKRMRRALLRRRWEWGGS
jgi:RNA polymerase sigma-70 factor (ECF subfamily)